MNHKDKLKLARRLETSEEKKKKGFSVFDSKAWSERANGIASKIKKVIAKQKEVSRLRKERYGKTDTKR